ncbi:MAG TPA: cytochrome b/b6 domain-containing protein [Thermodesulfovibrionales bacterium]|nr:cytochrome b/b6 domain-containing protein [Thermodesulfovibrionales bacterium]
MSETSEARGRKMKRFSLFRIGEHSLIMIAFGLLVVTGLSQKFYSLDISEWFIFKAGGIDRVRLIHRYAGIFFSLMASVHTVIAIVGVIGRRWQPSMIITRKDFHDAIHNIKYYIGKEDHHSMCDRYTYKQKFVYWSIFVSGFIMIVTGLVLWFPAFFARFLPGEVIPAAKVMHTNQGFLMFLIIAVWHIYDSIFSPEIFPLDTSIFSGYISRERMVREHPLELARIENKAKEDIIAEQLDLEYRESLETD